MKIVFTGGGTLGPVVPLLATIEALKELKPESEPVWVGTRTGVERAFVSGKGIRYFWIPSGKLRRYFDLRNILSPFITAAGFLKALILLVRLRPKAVVGAGGFVQVPLVYAAKCLRIPVVIHQQDLEAGLANRLSARVASVVTTVFPEAEKELGKKIAVIGNPCRRLISDLVDPSKRAINREAGVKRWLFDGTRPTILVLGGGTGAAGLNQKIVQCLDEFLSVANVLLISGKGKMPEIEPRKNFVAVEFLNEEMAEAYAIADLVVCRVGLGTLTEIGTLGLPAVLVPFAGHQEKNAAYFASKGAAVALAPDVSDAVFSDTILRLLADRDRRLLLGQKIADLFPPDAARRLAQMILEKI